MPERAASCPTTTLRTSSRTAVTASRGDACTGAVRVVLLGGMGDLPMDSFCRLGQRDKLGVAGRFLTLQGTQHIVPRHTGTGRRHVGDNVGRRVRSKVQPLGEGAPQ